MPIRLVFSMKRQFVRILSVASCACVLAVGDVGLASFSSNLEIGQAYAAACVKKEPESRRVPSLKESVFKKLSKVQKLTGPEEGEPNFPEALKALDSLKRSGLNKWNRYELSQLYNYYGYVYYSLERTNEALKAYEKVLQQSPDIPYNFELSIMFTLAQLNFAEENYRKSLDLLEKWMCLSTIVGADVHYLKSQIHYQLDDKKSALASVNKAVEIYEGKNKIPPEGWYNLQRGLYYDRNDYKKTVQVLQKLIRQYPKIVYWKQLSSIYAIQERESNQLHSLEVVYLMGGLKKEKELLNLAYLFMSKDVPYKGARVIEKGMKEKIIEKTSKNLETLAIAWRLAEELQKSIPAMEAAASKSDKGDLHAQLAGIYLDNDENEKALSAGKKALDKKGKLKSPGNLHIIMGMASTNLKKYKDAAKSFKEAQEYKNTKTIGENWLKYVNREMRRASQLAQSI